MSPTKETAHQFALILSTGMPAKEAILYFLPEEPQEPGFVERTLTSWLRSKLVTSAIDALQGKPWSVMDPMERIRFAVNKTYNEMAYFLYSHNYAELAGADRAKADTCRHVLEQKIAGTSGQLSPVEAFWEDVLSGKRKLGIGTPLPVGQSA